MLKLFYFSLAFIVSFLCCSNSFHVISVDIVTYWLCTTVCSVSELCYTAVTWQFVCYVSNRVTIIISKCAKIAITRCNQQLMTSTKLHEYESRVTQTTTEYMTEIAKGNLVAFRGTTHSIPNTIFEKRLVTEKVTSRHFPPACGVMHSRMVSTNTVRLVLFLGETLLQQLLYSG